MNVTEINPFRLYPHSPVSSRIGAIRYQMKKVASDLSAPSDLAKRAEIIAMDNFEFDHDSVYRAILRARRWLISMMVPL